MSQTIKKFFQHEAASGFILVFAAMIAMILANSPLNSFYNGLLEIPVSVRFGGFEIAKPLILWVNDGLMAIFFFLVGLEIKREILGGNLSSLAQITLPAVAAVAGIGYLFAGLVDFQMLLRLLIGSIPGVLIGTYVGQRMDPKWLKLVLGGVLLLISLKLLLN